MTYITHSLGGFASGLLAVQLLGVQDPAAVTCITAGAAIGSLIPDLDHTKSKISKSSPAANAASHIAAAAFKHRGFLHTPVFVILATVMALAAVRIFLDGETCAFGTLGIIGMGPGMASHLVLDTLNPGGIMWLWPISRKHVHVASIKTNSLGEKAFSAGFLALIGLFFIGR